VLLDGGCELPSEFDLGVLVASGHPGIAWCRCAWTSPSTKINAEERGCLVADPEPVTVSEVSDNANEDRWTAECWQAECAAPDAAVAAGANPDELTVQRDHRVAVTVRTRDGREFRAVVRTRRSMHRVELPRVARPE